MDLRGGYCITPGEMCVWFRVGAMVVAKKYLNFVYSLKVEKTNKHIFPRVWIRGVQRKGLNDDS